MDTPEIVVEISDEEPTTEHVVAYDRFWRLMLDRLLRHRQPETQAAENQPAVKLAA